MPAGTGGAETETHKHTASQATAIKSQIQKLILLEIFFFLFFPHTVHLFFASNETMNVRAGITQCCSLRTAAL